jgi:membrane protease YdiL (CAAX protease family)
MKIPRRRSPERKIRKVSLSCKFQIQTPNQTFSKHLPATMEQDRRLPVMKERTPDNKGEPMHGEMMAYPSVRSKPWTWFRQEVLQPLLSSQAAWFYAAIWLAAALYLIVRGHQNAVLNGALFFFGTMLFCLFTVALTPHPPTPKESTIPASRGRLRWQTGATLIFIAITAYGGLAFHGLISEQQAQIPLWSPLMQWLALMAERHLTVSLIGSPGNSVVNPVSYFVLPLIVLVLLGARPRDLGMGPGHGTWRVLLIWCAIPVTLWIVQLTAGTLTLFFLARRLIGHALQNGFFEEFLFRGALQTRLSLQLSPAWALVLQALIFGVWHLGLGISSMGGDLWAGLASTIVSQSVFGLVAGILFWRTRNLVACSVVHVVLNSLG